MAHDATLGRSQLFEEFEDAELDVVAGRMRERRLRARRTVVRGRHAERPDPGDHGGCVRWTAGTTVGGGEIELRMRRAT